MTLQTDSQMSETKVTLPDLNTTVSKPTKNLNAENEITPELAAMIVKNYVLPMFETNAKKSLRLKYNRMSSAKKADFSIQNQPAGSVYGELKLSEKLDAELRKVK